MSQDFFQPSKRNIFGPVDDIIFWFAQKHGCNVNMDYKGEDIRLIVFPNGNKLLIKSPDNDEAVTTIVKIYSARDGMWLSFSSGRQKLYQLLEDLYQKHAL